MSRLFVSRTSLWTDKNRTVAPAYSPSAWPERMLDLMANLVLISQFALFQQLNSKKWLPFPWFASISFIWLRQFEIAISFKHTILVI